MNRTVSAFACVALGCISLAALAVGGTVMVVGHHTLYSLAELDATLREVNRPCGKNQSCGTLADVAKSLNTVRYCQRRFVYQTLRLLMDFFPGYIDLKLAGEKCLGRPDALEAQRG